MLLSLAVRDFVIVEELQLRFAAGFTVLTGETGAGKSLLVDALNLVLGERAEGNLIRSGKERADIAAEFDIAGQPGVAAWLAQAGLEGDPGVCLLRRTLEREGRSRAFVNGHAVTLQQLRELGDALVDIYGQFAHQSLLKADVQRGLLDDFGELGDVAQQVGDAYRRWQDTSRRRQERLDSAAQIERERGELDAQLAELEALRLAPDTWEQLVTEQARLSHAAALIEGTQAMLQGLREGEGALATQLHALIARAHALAEFDTAMKEIAGSLEAARIQVDEAALSLRRYMQRLDLDPQRLNEVEHRMQAIHALARKYKVRPDALAAHHEALTARRRALADDDDLAELARQEAAHQAAYTSLAQRLSAGRTRAAGTLTAQVTKALRSLAMADARVEVRLAPSPAATAHGAESIEFLVSPHRAIEPGPLNKIASGGELSRIGLAIQVVASKVARVPTLIFDEVDAGIGGGVAEIVGKLMRELGGRHQVMCVTHLPQVAAHAHHHLRVAKDSDKKGIATRIDTLDKSGRIDELARMLGGVTVTAATRKHASEMLGGNA